MLKPTGSIYLHCDPTASHYLKAVMDAIFGRNSSEMKCVGLHFSTYGFAKFFNRKHDIRADFKFL